MPHFLINKSDIEGNSVFLKDKETINHLAQSLRIKEGEVVKFIDEYETVYFSKISDIQKKGLRAEIIKTEKSKRKLDIKLCALISVLKPDGMNLAIQNAVQMGAKEIYTVYSDNCAVKRTEKSEKWQKIGMESFKQCERADIPKIIEPLTFEEVFSKFKKENIIIFAEKDEEFKISDLKFDKNEKILAVFGPEGGFSDKEFRYFKKENFKLVTLGNLILKAPNAITAGLFGIIQNAG